MLYSIKRRKIVTLDLFPLISHLNLSVLPVERLAGITSDFANNTLDNIRQYWTTIVPHISNYYRLNIGSLFAPMYSQIIHLHFGVISSLPAPSVSLFYPHSLPPLISLHIYSSNPCHFPLSSFLLSLILPQPFLLSFVFSQSLSVFSRLH